MSASSFVRKSFILPYMAQNSLRKLYYDVCFDYYSLIYTISVIVRAKLKKNFDFAKKKP